MAKISIRRRISLARRAACILFGLSLFSAPAFAQEWELVWSDEFEEAGLPDPAKWSYDVGGGGWGNEEVQYYTESRLENARVEGGVLIIEAHKESYIGHDYTSARIASRGKGDWTYGRVEAMAKVPSGRGTWAAFWMLSTNWIYGDQSWPANGEIDILEYVGFDADKVHGSIHTESYNSLIGTQKTTFKSVPGVETAFHLYAVEWSPERIDFFVDDTRYAGFLNEQTGWRSWPFDQDFHVLLNLAIGGIWGGQEGIDDGIFPQQYQIDFVRVFRNTAVPEVTLSNPLPGSSFDAGATIDLSALASDVDGTISEVVFLQGDGVLDVDSEPPYASAVAGVVDGCYAISARARDDQGWFTLSDTVDVTVGSDCTQSPYLMVPHAIPGSIEAEYYDLGGAGEAYLDLDAQNSGLSIRRDDGVDIETTADAGGGHNVTAIAGREWLEYTVDVAEARTYTVEARVASGVAGGSFQLEIGGVDVTGPIAFGATGGAQTWTTVNKEGVALDQGTHVLRLRFLESGFGINKLTFLAESGTSTESDPAITHGPTLQPNFPNPFTGSTQIAYTVTRADRWRLEVYDLFGRRRAVLQEAHLAPGSYTMTAADTGLPSGTYILRLSSSTSTVSRKMTVVR